MNDLSQNAVRFLEVSEEESGQRLDNYLLRNTSGVPKTRIYRAIRKGEVRVNKGRSKVDYRVQATDVVAYHHCRLASRPPASPRAGKDCVTLFCLTIQICRFASRQAAAWR